LLYNIRVIIRTTKMNLSIRTIVCIKNVQNE